jgi:hypothetical protein
MGLSRTLERVRAAFRRRTPGRHSRSAPPPQAPPAPHNRPTPDAWGARLVTARRTRRERHAPPVLATQPQPRAEMFQPDPWEHTGAMVRPYVGPLGGTSQTHQTGAQGAPWGNAQ